MVRENIRERDNMWKENMHWKPEPFLLVPLVHYPPYSSYRSPAHSISVSLSWTLLHQRFDWLHT